MWAFLATPTLHMAATSESAKPDEEVQELVAILDAGAQYGKVIDRRVRELNVNTIIFPLETSAEELYHNNLKALIISGSGNSVNDSSPIHYDPNIFSLGVPILGICYGFHTIIKHYGGEVSKGMMREDGQFEVILETDNNSLFESMERNQQVLLTHGDSVKTVPDCLKAIGWSGELITAVHHITDPVYGVQFHPEVDLTINGRQILKNFLYQISGCHGSYHLSSREASCLEYIRDKVGEGHVLSLVSGGVDSTVSTALISKALGPNKVTAVHIDNGFLRKNEIEQVVASLARLGISAQVIRASLRFSSASTIMNYRDKDGSIFRQATPLLNTVINPEEKRHIIGDAFVTLASSMLKELDSKGKRPIFLAQGTLRPDLIESASSLVSANAHVIKTHHNDSPLVRELRKQGLVLEPLSDFHKDEVRQLGLSLDIPESIVNRHPFPGPGLAIRIICQEEAIIREDFSTINSILNTIATYAQCLEKPSSVLQFLSMIQDCTSSNDQAFLSELSASLTYFITLLPIYTVGVQGDSRSYSYAAVISSDDESKFSWKDRMKLAKLLPKILHTINRVVWGFGKAIYGPVCDVTPTHLTTGIIATLREADHQAHSVLASHGLMGSISQMPVVLIPIHFDRNYQEIAAFPSCQRSVVLRPFVTCDFMTGVPAMPGEHIPLQVLDEMVAAIKQVPGLSRVLYDLTPKPPGTTEWE
ncbi:PREDICTED: GMP synthase [glutamine-hydrolyzing]-like isoform X1 [Amphimedon queenslandica]|uniref:GMP synthase (glutamine-hydrolyzing) n=1 Tax=Amphimedon queenslandica TaxID=400682 RepID=A0A1X7VGM5_AMPQE|nr:PREDICTED: GMP synthase [glutamine-hydrolyzing]-like isoform X1 [Amphimedon queenslandica]|eukprot:XP_003384374.2 PREDICTED: GMP synthase [glutamine-hydrolyzing]-like isoform X1 [Amphimedon queenslandica]